MKLLKKTKQLESWGKKNKISNKKFSTLTGLKLKKLKKSKKLPKFVGLSCRAIENIKKISDQEKIIKNLQSKNKSLNAKIIKFKKPSKKIVELKKANKSLEAKLKKPKKQLKN